MTLTMVNDVVHVHVPLPCRAVAAAITTQTVNVKLVCNFNLFCRHKLDLNVLSL